jgi:hypothetical protein
MASTGVTHVVSAPSNPPGWTAGKWGEWRPGGWPSGIRKVGATPSLHLTVDEQVKPIEQHGFTLADFTPGTILLRFFKWDVNSQPVDALDTLEPFHTAELKRPG